jgi:hypothetical protein
MVIIGSNAQIGAGVDGSRSIVIGYFAQLQGAASLTDNIIIGYGGTTNGPYNIGIGSGVNVNGGTNAVAIGYSSSSGANNSIAVGVSAAATGNNAIAIGYGALSPAVGSTVVGNNSAVSVNTGAGTILLGANNGSGSGINNTFIGQTVGNTTVSSGYQNVVIGGSQFNYFTTAANNVVAGYGAGAGIFAATNSVMVGASAGVGCINGTNTAVGYSALSSSGNNTYAAGTASQSTTTITGAGTTWTNLMVGGIITYVNGDQAPITAFVNSTSLTTTTSQSESAQAYEIYYGTLYNTGTIYQSFNAITGSGTTFTSAMVGGYIVYPVITASITNASGDSTTVTYTAVNSFVTNQTVQITGMNPSVYNISGIVASATGSQFTILSSVTGSFVSGGTATGRSQYATITNAVGSGSIVTYTATNNFIAGQFVTVTSVNPSAYNINGVVLAAGLSSSQFELASTATGSYVSGGFATNGTTTQIVSVNSSTSLTVNLGSVIYSVTTPGSYKLYYTTASRNTAIGNLSGTGSVLGSNNTLLGDSSNVGPNVSSAVVVGQNASATYNSVVIGQGINDTTGGASVAGLFMYHRGPITTTVNMAGWISGTNELVEVTSSRRFKENIRTLEYTSDNIDKLRPVRFTPKLGHGRTPDDTAENLGFIAEEVEEIYPEVVTKDSDGATSGMMYDRLVPVLLRELQLLRARVAELESIVKK